MRAALVGALLVSAAALTSCGHPATEPDLGEVVALRPGAVQAASHSFQLPTGRLSFEVEPALPPDGSRSR